MVRSLLLPMMMLLASAQSAPEPPVTPPPPPEDPLRCGRGDYIGHFLEVAPAIARQGTSLTLAPKQLRGHAGTHDVPFDCTSDWSVSDPRHATLSQGRRHLTIAADAPPGATITISYRSADRPVKAVLTIVGRDQLVLAGTRSQISGCRNREPVRELVLTTEGRFSATFMPFETYNDYWGRYSFDPETGRIAFTLEGGNFTPPGLDLEGWARLEGSRSLVVEGVYFGDRGGAPSPGSAGCRYLFR